ncbi:MAG: VCBS repeat-containing protein [Planctomycetes bacterium]|nr:VCBS repeat-containing protein [Planctomycetota bacterium]
MLWLLASSIALTQAPGVAYAPASPPLRLADPVPYFAPTSWIWPGPSGLMGRVVRDFNNDGSPDVAFAFGGIYATPPELRTWLGDGEGGFAFGSATPLLGNPGSFQGGDAPFPAADFDLDGVLDLVVPMAVGPTSQILRGDGLGGFLPWPVPSNPPNYQTVGGTFGYLAAGDIEGDGDPDLVLAALGFVNMAQNAGGGVFGTAPFACNGFPLQVASGSIVQTELRDLDNDLIVDYVSSGGVIQILQGFGNGCFAYLQSQIYWLLIGPPANDKYYAWGDFNGDGVDDLVLASIQGGGPANPINVAVYLRASSTSSTWNLGPTFVNPGWLTGVAAADLDLDGYDDFVVTEIASPTFYSAGGNRTRVYRNLGAGTAFQATPRSEGYTWWVSHPVLTDVNGDGYPDLFVNQRGQPTVTPPAFAVALNTTGGSDIEVIGRPQIGRTVHLDLEGTALASWTLVASSSTGPLLSFPGFQGGLGLDPTALFVMASGVFPSDGNTLVPVSIPNNPALVGGIVHLQYASLLVSSPPGSFSGITSVTIR